MQTSNTNKAPSDPPVSGDASQQRLEALGYKQELNRTMSLYHVVVYGLIYMVPLAPLQVFGFTYNLSGGMVAAVYAVAAVAMYFSAVSYSEMAQQFPVAGSVYSYVRGWRPGQSSVGPSPCCGRRDSARRAFCSLG